MLAGKEVDKKDAGNWTARRERTGACDRAKLNFGTKPLSSSWNVDDNNFIFTKSAIQTRIDGPNDGADSTALLLLTWKAHVGFIPRAVSITSGSNSFCCISLGLRHRIEYSDRSFQIPCRTLAKWRLARESSSINRTDKNATVDIYIRLMLFTIFAALMSACRIPLSSHPSYLARAY